MLIPYGTDAPLYRPPWGTIALIVVNVVLYLIQDVVTPRSMYVLSHGNGLHPIQWLLSAFAHGSVSHLVGNMIFLFSLGVLVESMMKCRHYLTLYLAIAMTANVVEQLCMLGAVGGGSLGASGVIYGLMLVGSISAPDKNIKWIFVTWHFEPSHFQVPVLINCIFYFMYDFTVAMYNGFEMGTPMLHVAGGVVGMIWGVAAYRLGWFCLDGEDLFSRTRELVGLEPIVSHQHRQRTQSRQSAPKPNHFGDLKSQVNKLDQYLDEGRYGLAKMKLQQIRHDHRSYRLVEKQLVAMIKLASTASDWPNVTILIRHYLRRFDSSAATMRLCKARIEIVELADHQSGAATLADIRPDQLGQQQRSLYRRLLKRASAGRVEC